MNAPESPTPGWDQRQRFRLLEALLISSGGLRLSDLRDHFDIGTRRAERDLREYAQYCPGNLDFDAQTGIYRASDDFVPRFMPAHARDWLPLLRSHGLADGIGSALGSLLPSAVESLEPPARDFDVAVLHRLVTAIREKRAVRIDYQSMSSDTPRSLRIEPHALVDVGRWHARAWSELHNDWRDFLLSRIYQRPDFDGASSRDPQDDWDWQHHVSVRLVAHPGLTPHQRAVVENDYAMTHGVHERPVRIALVPYYLRMHGVGRGDRDRPAAEQQIVLANADEIAALDRLGRRP